MELEFKRSNVMCTNIVNMNGRKYVVDPLSLTGKRYFFGLLPQEVTVQMIELEERNHSFEIRGRTNVGAVSLAIVLQPLTKFLYNLTQQIFLQYGLSQQLLMKSVIFTCSMFFSFLVVLYLEYTVRKRFAQRIPQNSRIVKLRFRPNGKRIPILLVVGLLHLAFFATFLGVNNGSEGAFLVINGFIALFSFIFLQMPMIETHYRNKELILEKVEEVGEYKESYYLYDGNEMKY